MTKIESRVIPEELWKDIEGFEGKYQISNYGRVRSTGKWAYNPNPWKILSQGKSGWGYPRVRLYIDNTPSYYSVSVLVAKYFIPNPENKPQVNHKDGNKENNFWENLEWVTIQENVLHAKEIGLSPQIGNIAFLRGWEEKHERNP